MILFVYNPGGYTNISGHFEGDIHGGRNTRILTVFSSNILGQHAERTLKAILLTVRCSLKFGTSILKDAMNPLIASAMIRISQILYSTVSTSIDSLNNPS